MNKWLKKFLFSLFLLGLVISTNAQDSSKVKKFHLKGYQEFLGAVLNYRNPNIPLSNQQILHNRLEAQWDIFQNLKLNAALRTQLVYGNLVSQTPNYGKTLSKQTSYYFNMDDLILNNKDIVAYTNLDRLNATYTHKKLQLVVGRQRINWGIATLWNPNDLFNAYNFTDFDYIERPGTDAFRLSWFRKWNSSLELAGNVSKNIKSSTIAMRYKFGVGSYDIQTIAAKYFENISVGGGFAGNLWNGSLRGEGSYFQNYNTEKNSVAATLEYQRSTTYNLNFTAGFLYNSLGKKSSILNLFAFSPSAQNLYPYKYSAFVQTSYQLNPLLTAAVSLVYSTNQFQPSFISPNITYSAAENFDIDFFGQIVSERNLLTDKYNSPLQAFYLRFKYSF